MPSGAETPWIILVTKSQCKGDGMYHIVEKPVKIWYESYQISDIRSIVETIEVIVDTGRIRREQVFDHEVSYTMPSLDGPQSWRLKLTSRYYIVV